jgi:hypothetical protein
VGTFWAQNTQRAPETAIFGKKRGKRAVFRHFYAKTSQKGQFLNKKG